MFSNATPLKKYDRTSLEVPWLRIRLPMQWTRSSKIPHAMEQLSPYATTTEPGLCSATRRLQEACAPEQRVATLHPSAREKVYMQ